MLHWMLIGGLAAATGIFSWGMAGYLKDYAVRRNVLDHPNQRSAHKIPTPRGGGLAFVAAFMMAAGIAAAAGWASTSLVLALVGAGAIVALIGFWDDHGHIPAGLRLIAHFIAAAWLIAWLGDIPRLSLFGVSLPAGAIGYAAAALFTVWLLNLYNFMDGIDGIASVQAITTAASGAIIYLLLHAYDSAVVPFLLAASVLGFLVWNWPPAGIFMGDVGSGFLGITSAGLALHAGIGEPSLFVAWLILLGVFVVDATLTLARRGLRGERIHEAHRSHAYQRAARHYRSHRTVTIAVALINLLWLLPMALAVALQWLEGALGLLIAYLPLAALGLYWGAGAQDERLPR